MGDGTTFLGWMQVCACPNTPIGRILSGNNTPQAYPAVDAQTGGLLFSGSRSTMYRPLMDEKAKAT